MKTIKLILILAIFGQVIFGQGQNRTTAKSTIDANLPSGSGITAAELRAEFKETTMDNVVFRLDVAQTQNKSSGAFSIDFEDVDQIRTTITGTSGSTVTISNLEEGDVKYWYVSKSATETISWAAAVDKTAHLSNYINTTSTAILYRITYKNSTAYAEAIESSQAAFDDAIESSVIESWTTPSLGSPYTTYAGNNVKYRKLNNLKQVQLKGAFTASSQSVNTLFTLASGYRPPENRVFAIGLSDAILTDGSYMLILIESDGTVRPLIVCSDSQIHYLDIIFPID